MASCALVGFLEDSGRQDHLLAFSLTVSPMAALFTALGGMQPHPRSSTAEVSLCLQGRKRIEGNGSASLGRGATCGCRRKDPVSPLSPLSQAVFLRKQFS